MNVSSFSNFNHFAHKRFSFSFSFLFFFFFLLIALKEVTMLNTVASWWRTLIKAFQSNNAPHCNQQRQEMMDDSVCVSECLALFNNSGSTVFGKEKKNRNSIHMCLYVVLINWLLFCTVVVNVWSMCRPWNHFCFCFHAVDMNVQ